MALTLKGHAIIAQRKVLNNLYLLRDFGYERIEKENEKKIVWVNIKILIVNTKLKI